MFPLRGRLRVQQGSLESGGSGGLTFYDCVVSAVDVRELSDFVRCSAKPLESITFVRCKFDPREDGLQNQLCRFFAGAPVSGLRKICLHTPTLSNEDVAQILDGAQDHLECLDFTWSYARAAALNRHLVYHQLYQLQTLCLRYGGMAYFAELDSEFTAALPNLRQLSRLELHGWNIRDTVLRELLNITNQMTSMQCLHLGNIKELTKASLRSLTTWGLTREPERLSVSKCSSLFTGADADEISAFFSKVSVRALDIISCNLRRAQVRTLLRAAGEGCRLSGFSLLESAFGLEEFVLLRAVLQSTDLKFLRIDEIAVHLSSSLRDQLCRSLEANSSLEAFEFNCRGLSTTTDTSTRIRKIMARNKRAHFVDRILSEVSEHELVGQRLLVQAIARMGQEGEGTTDVQRMLVNSVARIVGNVGG